jgi:hypothetical protein
MIITTAPVVTSNAEIAAKARDIHPVQFTGRMLLTTITFVFMSLGWVAGTSWYLAVFSVLWTASHLKWLGLCVRYGFVKGARHSLVPKGE